MCAASDAHLKLIDNQQSGAAKTDMKRRCKIKIETIGVNKCERIISKLDAKTHRFRYIHPQTLKKFIRYARHCHVNKYK